MNRYERLADLMEEQIRSGRIPAGQRMPSVRQLSAAEGVSPSTVVEAYELLQERGWVEARARSGFFATARPMPLAPVEPERGPRLPAAPLALGPDELIFALRQATHDPRILPLGAATPLPEYYPSRSVARCMRKALREEPALFAEYQFPPGSPSFRREVSRRYTHLGVEAPLESITTTSGAMEAIALSLRAVAGPGDVIAVESPTYFGVLQLASTLGYRTIAMPLDPRHGLDPARLEEAVRGARGRLRAAVVVANHSNPLGTRMADRAKAELVQVAMKGGVTLIEDDVYGDLSYDRHRPSPLKAFDRGETVILCGSHAKTVAPALRVGYAITSKHARKIALLKSALTSGTPALAEETLAVYLREGGYDRHLQWVRKEYRTLTTRFAAAIAAEFPEGTRVSQPSGGYVIWVQLPGDIDSREVQRRALDHRISVASGVLFSPSQEHRDHLRINCAVPWGPRIERGIARLGRIASDLLR